MAVRFPLYWDRTNGSMKAITEAQRQEIVLACVYEYGGNPSITLSVVSSGGSLGTINDTRLQAGAMTTHASSFQTPAGLGTNVTVNHSKVQETVASISSPNRARPMYYDGGNLKHMTQADIQDTFIKPAIDLLIDGSDRPGTYRVYTSSSLANHTNLGSIYTDTRADAAAYTDDAAGLGQPGGEAQDQPTTITTFYLLRTDQGIMTNPDHLYPFLAYADGNLKEFPKADFRSLLQDEMRYAAKDLTSNKIRYGYNNTLGTHTATGQNRGSGMTDTILNGSEVGEYQVGGDDYRSQTFPDGTGTAADTIYLRIRKE